MKITIDTKYDSPEDIRKLITLLETLLGEVPAEEDKPKAEVFDLNQLLKS